MNFKKIPVFSFFIVVLYLVAGGLIILRYWVLAEYPDTRFLIFGVCVVAYGLFRGFRAFRMMKAKREEEESNETEYSK